MCIEFDYRQLQPITWDTSGYMSPDKLHTAVKQASADLSNTVQPDVSTTSAGSGGSPENLRTNSDQVAGVEMQSPYSPAIPISEFSPHPPPHQLSGREEANRQDSLSSIPILVFAGIPPVAPTH